MGNSVRVLFSWEFVGPHHLARVRACKEQRTRIFALADRSTTYGFYEEEETHSDVTIAYRSTAAEDLSWWRRLRAYIRHVWGSREDVYFLCHYERPEVFLTAVILRLRMKKVFVMGDSKFDDYQRYVLREVGKSCFYLPYNGALVSGLRSESYLRFLGIRGKIETGYDTIERGYLKVGEDRLAEDLKPRSFFIVINRLVKRKNTELVIKAFAAFCLENKEPTDLMIVGEGPEEQALRSLVEHLGVASRVNFRGSVPNDRISSLLKNSIGLILMSTSEQWGLVINEAVACSIPVIVSDAVGARDSLVRNFINGFVIETDNLQGLTRAMIAVLSDRDKFIPPKYIADAATAERFAAAVGNLVATS